MAGESNEVVHREIGKLCPYSAYVSMVVDGYYVFFAPLGSRIGTDIEEGKLTWYILKALEKASPEQRKILEENYGKKNKMCVRVVKKVFLQVN